jgi:hypothetical protein
MMEDIRLLCPEIATLASTLPKLLALHIKTFLLKLVRNLADRAVVLVTKVPSLVGQRSNCG